MTSIVKHEQNGVCKAESVQMELLANIQPIGLFKRGANLAGWQCWDEPGSDTGEAAVHCFLYTKEEIGLSISCSISIHISQ